jgi:hypothetical protein
MAPRITCVNCLANRVGASGACASTTVRARVTRFAARRRVHQPDRRPGLPGGDPDRRPGVGLTFAAGPGCKWGYGLLLNTTDVPGMRRAYSGAWAGLFNTHFWVDPASGVYGSTFSNFVSFGPPEALELYANFEPAVYASR